MDQGQNVYRPGDIATHAVPSGPTVFISHRQSDKEPARAIARLLNVLDVHVWLDEYDDDIRAAAALGMFGDRALVHAIERGIRHATNLLGVLSPRTAGSWYVPFEGGYARADDVPANFVACLGRDSLTLPEFVSNEPIYWSVDELVRYAASLAGHHLHTDFPRCAGMRLRPSPHSCRSTRRRRPSTLPVAARCRRSSSWPTRRRHEPSP